MNTTFRFGALLTASLLVADPRGEITVCAEPTRRSDPDRISAPVVYENLMLIFASDDGVSAVVFTDKLKQGIEYKFRYESKDGKTRQSGSGKLFEKYKPVPGSKPADKILTDDGSQLWFKAGPFDVEWSFGGEGNGWIYYSPERIRVQIAHSAGFEKLELQRFAK